MSSSRRRTGHSSRAHRIEPANPETTSEENYVKWFTSKVLESIADPRPSIASAAARQVMADRRQQLCLRNRGR